ncbi:hypothetical protein [Undibacterium fentianense]|uniref:Aromatic ring-opening dioxygenase LigA n=1 Tax=Undibacterium fentianense TaxID=2828728 RepID=A0A941E2W1_9BURK|nr:hypothetical protein [Undibacterium fentianense]MBR7801355.1 hypothetical protein [Undibacterium fentianense]
MNIQLNFINLSNDQNNSDVLIFAKNIADIENANHIAWTVIKNCGQGDSHPFVYPIDSSIGASDSWGNYTPQFPVNQGEAFEMVLTKSGDQLRTVGVTHNPNAIELLNNLNRGAINAYVYKSGRLFASKSNLAPGQKAVFQFNPTIWIGVASQVEQGEVLNSAIISEINTEISLFGIRSADIVMTGGGSGPDAKEFQFMLQNVVM